MTFLQFASICGVHVLQVLDGASVHAKVFTLVLAKVQHPETLRCVAGFPGH